MFDVYILNINAEEKRRYVSEGGLLAMQVPFEKMKRWVAIDDLDFEKTHQVLENAIADGFPGFQQYLDKGQQNEYNIGTFTQTWNYCRFWRHVIESKKMMMLIQDDRRLGCTYPRLVEIVEELLSFDKDFKFLTLWCIQTYIQEEYLPIQYIKEGSPIAHGIYEGGTCAGHIVMPAGAKWLIENVVGFFPPRVEFAAHARACINQPLEKRKGIYTLADEDVNLKHMSPNSTYLPGRILASKEAGGLVRPIFTTRDD